MDRFSWPVVGSLSVRNGVLFPSLPDLAAQEKEVMAKLRRMMIGFLINLYLGFFNFMIYPILILILPSRIPEKVLKLQGDIHYFFAKRTRHKVIEILRKKLPAGISDTEVEQTAREYFRIQTSFFYYTFFLSFIRPKMWLDRFTTYEGLEHLEESLKGGKGVIMPTFHFDHPISVPGLLLTKDYRISVYAVHPWDLNVPLVVKLNSWIGYTTGSIRRDCEMAYRKRGAKEVYKRRLKENAIFIVLIDAPFPEKHDLKPAMFLGEPFLFPSSILDIIYETGVPVHIAYGRRDLNDWRYLTFVCSPRINMTGDPESDLQAIISAHEAAVLKHPEQWWGWSKFERGTVAYREEYLRRKEEERNRRKRLRPRNLFLNAYDMASARCDSGR
jgi:lauroyl/myristoyl acyltransferase